MRYKSKAVTAFILIFKFACIGTLAIWMGLDLKDRAARKAQNKPLSGPGGGAGGPGTPLGNPIVEFYPSSTSEITFSSDPQRAFISNPGKIKIFRGATNDDISILIGDSSYLQCKRVYK